MRGYKERDCAVLAAHYCQEARVEITRGDVLLSYVSISVGEGHFACILVLGWISIGLA